MLLIWSLGKHGIDGLWFLPDLSEKDEQDVSHIEALTSNVKPKASQITENQGRSQKSPDFNFKSFVLVKLWKMDLF